MNTQDNEKFTLQDFLTMEKQVTGTYNIWAGECVCPELRNKFLDILKEEHEIQNSIFQEMNSRGFYPVKPSEPQELEQLKQKFC
ncbi:MAG: spore coat protein [Clostridia bacterium]